MATKSSEFVVGNKRYKVIRTVVDQEQYFKSPGIYNRIIQKYLPENSDWALENINVIPTKQEIFFEENNNWENDVVVIELIFSTVLR